MVLTHFLRISNYWFRTIFVKSIIDGRVRTVDSTHRIAKHNDGSLQQWAGQSGSPLIHHPVHNANSPGLGSIPSSSTSSIPLSEWYDCVFLSIDVACGVEGATATGFV